MHDCMASLTVAATDTVETLFQILGNAGLQVAHAGASLFDAFFSLAQGVPDQPWFTLRRPAVCLLVAANWLLTPAQKAHASRPVSQDYLTKVMDWAWEACSHTSLLSPDTSLLDQVRYWRARPVPLLMRRQDLSSLWYTSSGFRGLCWAPVRTAGSLVHKFY